MTADELLNTLAAPSGDHTNKIETAKACLLDLLSAGAGVKGDGPNCNFVYKGTVLGESLCNVALLTCKKSLSGCLRPQLHIIGACEVTGIVF